MRWWQVGPAESVSGDPTRCPAAAYFLPHNRLLLSCVDVDEPTVSYCRSTLNLIHFNLTKVPADSAEEGFISAAVATPQLTQTLKVIACVIHNSIKYFPALQILAWDGDGGREQVQNNSIRKHQFVNQVCNCLV